MIALGQVFVLGHFFHFNCLQPLPTVYNGIIIKQTENNMLKNIAIILASIAVLGAVGYYKYYTWSDCLGENGVITCFAMLTK